MAGYLKAALCAVGLTCAGQADAAIFTYTFFATGTGTQVTSYSATGPNVVALGAAAFQLVLDTRSSGVTAAGDASGRPISFEANSLGFGFSSRTSGFTDFDGGGFACFANPTGTLPTSGAITTTQGCSNISIRQSFAGGTGVNFVGTITSFYVGAGGSLGDNRFSFIAAVPEPSTWALMLAGFGLTGYALRRKRARVAMA